MVSGVCEVAPSTPKPPARLTAATTSRQWLKASRGNSIPSMSQIGDFMVVHSRRQLFGPLVLCLNFREFSDNASPSGTRKPSTFPLLHLAPSGQETRSKNAFHVAKYATRQDRFVSCAFAPAGRMLVRNTRKIRGSPNVRHAKPRRRH